MSTIRNAHRLTALLVTYSKSWARSSQNAVNSFGIPKSLRCSPKRDRGGSYNSSDSDRFSIGTDSYEAQPSTRSNNTMEDEDCEASPSTVVDHFISFHFIFNSNMIGKQTNKQTFYPSGGSLRCLLCYVALLKMPPRAARDERRCDLPRNATRETRALSATTSGGTTKTKYQCKAARLRKMDTACEASTSAVANHRRSFAGDQRFAGDVHTASDDVDIVRRLG
ncbi:hypothetical protein HPB51_001469 [Rhipicephalus microplus]|uniref:Uncharacterized protein n=1 Tax=Rhipicephalus microplus TaxID=6941 RepID=A0A9J6DRZ4_RHIMP|nr:hypothetical protein HPB51_001469 [Rhipicephalus microplus]